MDHVFFSINLKVTVRARVTFTSVSFETNVEAWEVLHTHGYFLLIKGLIHTCVHTFFMVKVRRNFSLSEACVRKLEDLSRVYKRPMSHIVEDLVLGADLGKTESKKVRVNGSNMLTAEDLDRLEAVLGKLEDISRAESFESRRP